VHYNNKGVYQKSQKVVKLESLSWQLPAVSAQRVTGQITQ